MDEVRFEMGVEVDMLGSVVMMLKNVYASAFDVGVLSLLLCVAGVKFLWSNWMSVVNLGVLGLFVVDDM